MGRLSLAMDPPLCCSLPITAKTPSLPVAASHIFSPLNALPRRNYRAKPLRTVRCSLQAEFPVNPEQIKDSSSSSLKDRSIQSRSEATEIELEKVVYRCRFLAIFAVFGSLVGSILCFVKGTVCVVSSFRVYFVTRAKVMTLLMEAIDTYLLGTVMLVFGIGLYELFVCNIDTDKLMSRGKKSSNLFGLFPLKGRPKWLKITSVNELKSKLGHVIVMLLLIGFLEKTNAAAVQNPVDLLFFATSVLLCAGSLYLVSLLNEHK